MVENDDKNKNKMPLRGISFNETNCKLNIEITKN
jgi:hypothetical protein